MKRAFIAITILLASITLALPQTGQRVSTLPQATVPLSGNETIYVIQNGNSKQAKVSNINISPTGPLASTPSAVINVVDPQWAGGAKCDSNGNGGGTDDSAAINAATAAARAIVGNSLTQGATIVFPTTARCRTTNPLNFTGFNRPGVAVRGGIVDCATSGNVCIDALGSRFISWDITIGSITSTAPSIGIQVGRFGAGSADFMDFSRLRLNGYFTLAGIYVFAAENNLYSNLYCYNRLAGHYCLILDGYNHFNAQSTFVTQTLPTDVRQSMIGNNFVGGQIHGTASTAIWVGGTRQLRFADTYVVNVGGPAPPIESWCLAGDVDCNQGMSLDVHEEDGHASGEIIFDGTNATPTYSTLTFIESRPNPGPNLFQIGGSVTHVNLPNAFIRFASMPGGTQQLFDNPDNWTLSGIVHLPALANWNEPAGFSGQLCLLTIPNGEADNCVNYVPTLAINRNPDFTVDQPNAGGSTQTNVSNTLFVDGWRTRIGGAIGSVLTFQQSASSPPYGYSNVLATNDPSPYTTPAYQYYAFNSSIEGVDVAPLSWGNSKARYATLDYWVKCSAAPFTINGFIQNNGRSRTYLFNNTVSTANTWQLMRNTIPGDTTGTWTTQQNRVGALIGFGPIVGSNFWGTAGVWQAGEFYGTSSGSNQADVGSTTCSYTGVHFTPSPFHFPYQARTFSQELQVSQHWYRKSFQSSVVPAGAAGGAGAATAIQQVAGVSVASQITFSPPMYENNDSQVPSITFYSTGASTANCYNATAAADAGAATALNVSDSWFTASCAPGGAAAGNRLQVHWTADSGF